MDCDLDQCWYCRKKGQFHCEGCQFAFYCSEECKQQDKLRHQTECERKVYLSTCRSCGNRPAVLLHCGSCCIELYCNKACQKRRWPHHKSFCKAFRNKVFDKAAYQQITNENWRGLENAPWYIGNDIAEDYLRLHQNEGVSSERELRLLFAGVGDIKDVVRTVTDLPVAFKGKLHFVLNDHSQHTSARNLLFMYCTLTCPMAEHLVHIWYSMRLTPKVLKYLVAILKELTTLTYQQAISKMKSYVEISSNHWSHCVQIYKGWYDLALSAEAADKIAQTCQKIFSRSEIQDEINVILADIPKEHLSSAKDFYDQHLLLPMDSSERRDAVFPNCTMTCYNPFNPQHEGQFVDLNKEYTATVWYGDLNPNEEMVYCVRAHNHVLSCWDYLVVKETSGKKDDILDMYLSYLGSVFQTFVNRVTSGCATFRFIIDDFRCLNQYLDQNETFDRVSASTLNDYFNFPFLLEQFAPRLNKENSCSVLITHHENWIIYEDPYEKAHSRAAFERRNVDAKQKLNVCADDYIDTTSSLFTALLCEVVAYLEIRANEKLIKHPKHPEKVARQFGLRLRDYCSELNHVVPFKRDTSRLRISLQQSDTRHIEWILL